MHDRRVDGHVHYAPLPLSDNIIYLDETEQAGEIEREIERYERYRHGLESLSPTEVEELIEWVCVCSPWIFDDHTCQFRYVDELEDHYAES